MNIQDIYVSACRGAFDRNVYDVRLIDWLENVRPQIPLNDYSKKQLPAIMPHGLFGTRRQDTFKQHSGLVQIDIDAKHQKSGFKADEVLEHMQCEPHILASGLSCSGSGVYALVAVDCEDMEENAANVHTDVADHVRLWAERVFTVKCDWPVMGNLSSLRFASPYPPYINLDVEPMEITL